MSGAPARALPSRGAEALATLVHAAPDVGAWLERVRAPIGNESGAIASNLGNLLVIRLPMAEPLRLRQAFGRIFAALADEGERQRIPPPAVACLMQAAGHGQRRRR